MIEGQVAFKDDYGDIHRAEPGDLLISVLAQAIDVGLEEVEPGQMIYIPHGWLHDVICLSDSISVTWNFVHRKGASEFVEYLKANPSEDSEFEVLQYFYKRAGMGELTADEILAKVA